MADERELWERICSRDANAFEAFYRDNARRLCAYLRQIVGSSQAVEDVMQERIGAPQTIRGGSWAASTFKGFSSS